MSTKQEAVMAAQRQLLTEQPKLRVDGIWGPKTDATYVSAPSQVQTAVVKTVESFGFTLEAVRQKFALPGVWITHAEAVVLAQKASKAVGLRNTDYLEYLLRYEPAKRQGAAGVEYNALALSPNGLYKGLFQVGAPAWTDATRVAAAAGISLGNFEGNWQDPFKNAVAAAGFAIANIRYSRDKGYNGPFSNDVLYAMHNQGHTFITSARRGGYGNYFEGQSGAAKKVLIAASEQVRSASA